MKPIDLTSTLVAGILGAVLLSLAGRMRSGCYSNRLALIGFAVGAGTQIGVRVTGVS